MQLSHLKEVLQGYLGEEIKKWNKKEIVILKNIFKLVFYSPKQSKQNKLKQEQCAYYI